MLLPVMAGYAIGSVPFGYLAARRRGVDLRKSGSGNVGAANAYRTSGLGLGVAIMLVDVAKGAGAVIVAEWLAAGMADPVAAGIAAILGHVYPPWLGFRGGKGVATATGVFVLLAPLATMIAAVAFLVTVWWTRYVSLGSIIASVVLAGSAAITDGPPAVIGAVIAAAIILQRHRGNLARLMAGTERRLGASS